MITVDDAVMRLAPPGLDAIAGSIRELAHKWDNAVGSFTPDTSLPADRAAEEAGEPASPLGDIATVWNQVVNRLSEKGTGRGAPLPADPGDRQPAAATDRIIATISGGMEVISHTVEHLWKTMSEAPGVSGRDGNDAVPYLVASRHELIARAAYSQPTAAAAPNDPRVSLEVNAGSDRSSAHSLTESITLLAGGIDATLTAATAVSQPLVEALASEAMALQPVAGDVSSKNTHTEFALNTGSRSGGVVIPPNAHEGDALRAVEEIRETLAYAVGMDAENTRHIPDTAAPTTAVGGAAASQAILPGAATALAGSSVYYDGDALASSQTTVTISGIAITVNGSDGESVASGIANNLAAKTQQAYMGDGSVGR